MGRIVVNPDGKAFTFASGALFTDQHRSITLDFSGVNIYTDCIVNWLDCGCLGVPGTPTPPPKLVGNVKIESGGLNGTWIYNRLIADPLFGETQHFADAICVRGYCNGPNDTPCTKGASPI